jgi:hypothetical protein
MQLDVSGFSGRYVHLNGSSSPKPSRGDFIRSLITVGYRSASDADWKVGPWRQKILFAMAMGYLHHDLRTTRYFRNLDQSEKVGACYLFGEAFTHWFAQTQLGLPFLLHVAGLKTCVWQKTHPLPPKPGATPPAPKSRPDLVGFRQGEYHVFESKGGQKKPSGAAVAHALGQVSALTAILKTQPPPAQNIALATRCASFLTLRASGAVGRVIDPPGEELGHALSFCEGEAIRSVYRMFPKRRVRWVDLGRHEDFVGYEIDDEVYLCVDRNILQMARDLAGRAPIETGAGRVFEALASRSELYRSMNSEDLSVGPDGIALLDRTGRINGRPRRKSE